MLRSLLILVASAFPLALIACPAPHPVVPTADGDATVAPPVGDTGPQTACQAACTTLVALGCSEGLLSDCPGVLEEVETDRLIRTPSGQPLNCTIVAAASSVAAVQAAGVRCASPSSR